VDYAAKEVNCPMPFAPSLDSISDG